MVEYDNFYRKHWSKSAVTNTNLERRIDVPDCIASGCLPKHRNIDYLVYIDIVMK